MPEPSDDSIVICHTNPLEAENTPGFFIAVPAINVDGYLARVIHVTATYQTEEFESSATSDLLIHICKGMLILHTENGQHILRAGTVLRISKGTKYRFSTETSADLFSVAIHIPERK